MKILVVGGGGREHAIVWKLAQSEKTDKIYCAPGNAGISGPATCVPIKGTETKKIVEFAKTNKIDLVFVAPDDPLAMGLVNMLEKEGIKAFGPTKEAAIIEASKSFAKDLMKKYRIPTGEYKEFSDIQKACEYASTLKPPIVVKADGLALGKGVIIAQTNEEAFGAIKMMLEEKAFGDAGDVVLIEEFLEGRELTVLAFSDGNTIVPMINSRDHKKALDNDEGLNTGGMGAVCPGENLTCEQIDEMMDKIFIPTLNAMKKEGRIFKGVLYFGLMLTESGPKVIEYNARFGDPEAQAVLPLLKTDLVQIIEAVIENRLDSITIEWEDSCSCCVVAASGGYPEKYEKGYEIKNLDNVDCLVFHAGTAIDKSGEKERVVTAGGRVLGVTALGNTIEEAIGEAYRNIKKIDFEKMHYRTDIGKTK